MIVFVLSKKTICNGCERLVDRCVCVHEVIPMCNGCTNSQANCICDRATSVPSIIPHAIWFKHDIRKLPLYEVACMMVMEEVVMGLSYLSLLYLIDAHVHYAFVKLFCIILLGCIREAIEVYTTGNSYNATRHTTFTCVLPCGMVFATFYHFIYNG